MAIFWAESSAYAAYAQEFIPPRLADGHRLHIVEFRQSLTNSISGLLNHFLPVPVGPADRLGDDAVDDPKPEEGLGSDLHVGRGIHGPA